MYSNLLWFPTQTSVAMHLGRAIIYLPLYLDCTILNNCRDLFYSRLTALFFSHILLKVLPLHSYYAYKSFLDMVRSCE